MRLRTLVADDEPLAREWLRNLLSLEPDVEVVGEVGDGFRAVVAIQDLKPDVVFLDVQMPGLDGIAATRELTGRHPHLAIVVLTMSEDDDTVFQAMRAGARGYLAKGAGQHEIARAIRAVAAGELVFGAAVAQRVAAYFAGGAPAPAAEAFPSLTAREREILDLLAAGRSNPQIAQTLFLAPKTVRNAVSNIFAKLQVADRAEAIVRARDAGLGRP